MTSNATPVMVNAPRLKRATQLAQALGREIIAENPPLISEQTLIAIEALIKPVKYQPSIIPPRGNPSYFSPEREPGQGDALIEQILSVSGLGEIYKALFNDPATLEALSQEAASYAVSKPSWPNALQLLEQGLNLSLGADKAVSASIRRTADRNNAGAPERALNRALPLTGSGYDEQFDIFAANAIHSRVDPRLGRLRRDGLASSGAKTKANVFSNDPRLERPNYSQILSQHARSCMTYYSNSREELEGRSNRFPSSAALNGAFETLSRAVADRAKIIAAERQVEWLAASGAKEPYEMAQRVWGSLASLADINKFAAHAQSAEKLLNERGPLGLFSLRVARGFGVEGVPEDLVGHIKARMSALGMSEGGWKRLNQIDPDISLIMAASFSLPLTQKGGINFRQRDEGPLRAFSQALSVGVASNLQTDILNEILALLGSDKSESREFASSFHSLCRPTLGETRVSSIEQAQNYIAESQAKQELLPQVLKAFFTRANQVGASLAAGELELFKDYVSSSEMGVWQQIPRGANWGQLMRMQREWHELVERSQHGVALEWASPVKSFESEESGYEARALTSGYELLKEGKAMHHCVSSYAKRCHEGSTLIFSITRSSERFGTLEIKPQPDGSYQVAQFKGLCNAVIEPSDAWEFARQLSELCSVNARIALKSAPALPAPSP